MMMMMLMMLFQMCIRHQSKMLWWQV